MKLVNNGISHYFKRDIIEHWTTLGDTHVDGGEKNRRIGWESFSDRLLG